jgi:predicted MFS family arabinose efflux permease
MRAALRHRDFRRLLAGLAVSQVGDWLYNLALVVLMFDRTHSAAWVGATTAARVVPVVVLGPLGGALCDRFDRRWLMIWADVARAALMAALAVVATTDLPVIAVPVIAALATTAATPYLPSVAATTPRLVPDDDLPAANALRSVVTQVGVVAGPAFGGLLLVVASPAVSFAVNAVSFGLSALAVLAIPAGPAFSPARDGAAPREPGRDLGAGLAALRSTPGALRLVGADVLCSFVYGSCTVLLVLVSGRLGLGANGFGYLLAGFGIGGITGAFLAGRVLRLPRQSAVLAIALCAVALPLPLLAVSSSVVIALALTAVSGSGAVIVEVLMETGLQRLLDESVFGRAYGVAVPASIGGIVIGSLVAPLGVSTFGVAATLAILGAVVAGYAIAQVTPRLRGVRWIVSQLRTT